MPTAYANCVRSKECASIISGLCSRHLKSSGIAFEIDADGRSVCAPGKGPPTHQTVFARPALWRPGLGFGPSFNLLFFLSFTKAPRGGQSFVALSTLSNFQANLPEGSRHHQGINRPCDPRGRSFQGFSGGEADGWSRLKKAVINTVSVCRAKDRPLSPGGPAYSDLRPPPQQSGENTEPRVSRGHHFFVPPGPLPRYLR